MPHNRPTFPSGLRRRIILSALLFTCTFTKAVRADASLTGVAPLDTPAVPVKVPSGVFFVAITRAGERLVAVGEHGVVICSDDEGATWWQAQVPVTVTLTCVAFATPLLGWAAGHFGVILATTDGGKTWVEQLNGIQVNQLALAAAQAIPPGDTTSPAFALGLKRAEFFVQLGPDKPFLTLVALSSQNIMVFGAYRMAVVTNDGGKTWNDISLQIYDRLSHDLYCAARVGDDLYIAAETGLVFRSTDGGSSFPQVAQPGAATLFGLLGAPDGSLVAFGVAGNCFRSVDGAQSWTQIVLPTQDDLNAGHVLASGAVILVGGGGEIFISRDNGASFRSVAGMPPRPISDFTETENHSLVFAGGAGMFNIPLAALQNA
jgi:photosystem II stability/assembly factor-like uncharacterized protein